MGSGYGGMMGSMMGGMMGGMAACGGMARRRSAVAEPRIPPIFASLTCRTCRHDRESRAPVSRRGFLLRRVETTCADGGPCRVSQIRLDGVILG